MVDRAFKRISDVAYVESLDFYLIHIGGRILKKGIDALHPTRFTSHRLADSPIPSKSLKLANAHKKLITLSQDNKRIVVIDLETQIVDISTKSRHFIHDFMVFGDDEDQVVSLLKKGFIMIDKFDYFNKSTETQSCYKFDLLEEREEELGSVTICCQNEYLLIQTVFIQSLSIAKLCSRFAILKLDKKGLDLTNMAILDEYDNLFRTLATVHCLGYLGNHILWIGLTNEFSGLVQVFDFDMEAIELKELKEKRVDHQELDVLKVVRVNNRFYYTGANQKIMRLRIKI